MTCTHHDKYGTTTIDGIQCFLCDGLLHYGQSYIVQCIEIRKKCEEKKKWLSTWKGTNTENGRIYQILKEILGDKE